MRRLRVSSVVPLYQDYCVQEVQDEPQVVQDDPQTLGASPGSELLTASCLQPLLISQRCPEARALPLGRPPTTPSPSRHPIYLSSCWRDLDEVKESGLLGTMTTREIRLQEV